jgi:hypothetical protein
MYRLSPVLTTRDLPLAELHAARLDGELVALDDAFTPIDQPHGREARAASLALSWPERLIAERHSAAWIWGALDRPPSPHELCASLGARARASIPRRVIVREVAIADDEVVVIASQRVTTPLRTLTDLARFDAQLDPAVLRSIARIGRVSLDDIRAALDRRRNLPNKRSAWELLRSSLS